MGGRQEMRHETQLSQRVHTRTFTGFPRPVLGTWSGCWYVTNFLYMRATGFIVCFDVLSQMDFWRFKRLCGYMYAQISASRT